MFRINTADSGKSNVAAYRRVWACPARAAQPLIKAVSANQRRWRSLQRTASASRSRQ